MKWAVSLLCCLGCGFGPAAGAELTEGRTVFLMPMSHGLDQFVANCLTRMHVFQVVTDPAKADAVITDQVGMGFEDRMNDLYPPPPTPESEAADKAKNEKAVAKALADQDSPPRQTGLVAMLGDTANKVDKPGVMSLSGRSRGTIFLVDVKSRQVLWSLFERPKNTNPHELDHTAERIVKRLKEDINPKTK